MKLDRAYWEDYWTKSNNGDGPPLDPKAVIGRSILDAGCERCGKAQWLISLGCKYVGMDISMTALKRNRGINPEGLFVQADVRALPFKGKCLDVFLIRYLETYFDEAEWRTILKEGERVCQNQLVVRR